VCEYSWEFNCALLSELSSGLSLKIFLVVSLLAFLNNDAFGVFTLFFAGCSDGFLGFG